MFHFEINSLLEVEIIQILFLLKLNKIMLFVWVNYDINMHINFISIRFLVVDLRFLVIKIDSRFRKIKQIVICQLKTVLNILRQFSAHTSRIVMLNMHVNFISIRFLIADLGFLPIKIDFAVSKNRTDCYMQTQNCT